VAAAPPPTEAKPREGEGQVPKKKIIKKKPSALETYKKTLRSPKTRDEIHNKLNPVFNALNIPGSSIEEKAEYFAKKAKSHRWLEDNINRFVDYGKERVTVKKDLTAGTLRLFFITIKGFCEMSDLGLTLNWKRIAKGLPKGSQYADDTFFTPDELTQLLKHADRRLKAIVYTLCSTGMRVGAFEYLNWGHIEPITNYQYLTWKKKREELLGHHEAANKIVVKEQEDKENIIAARVKVYAGEAERHYVFITPEAYFALKDYIDYRKKSGENITKDSPVIRYAFQTIDVNVKTRTGRIKNPERLSDMGIERELGRAEKKEGLHTDLEPGVRRHKVKTSHGFRKFFETTARNLGLSEVRIAQLRGDAKLPGNSGHYDRPDDYVVLEDYLKIVEALTIDQNHRKVAVQQQQIKEITERQDQSNYIIMGKLAEKEKESEEMKAKIANLEMNMGAMDHFASEMTKLFDLKDQVIGSIEHMIDNPEKYRKELLQYKMKKENK
jgi:integrase